MARASAAGLTRAAVDLANQSGKIREQAAEWWALRCFCELDQALVHLHFNRQDDGLIVIRTKGDPDNVSDTDSMLAEQTADWLVT